MKRGWKLVLVLAGLALIAVALVWAVSGRPGFPPLPQPNGYDLLVRAASQVTEIPSDYRRLPDDELARLVEKNQAALRVARDGLALPSAVPVEYGEQLVARQRRLGRPSQRLAWLLEAEAIMLSRRGDTNGALQSCLDLVRYGRAIAAEGVQLDFLNSSRYELLGVRRMTNLLAGLTAEQCRAVSRALEKLEGTRDPRDAIVRRERAWERGSFGIVDRVKGMVEVRSLDPTKEWKLHFRLAYEDSVHEMRLTLLRVAARAYELETGHPPGAASDLVPRYLSTVPLDPETSTPIRLHDKPRDRLD